MTDQTLRLDSMIAELITLRDSVTYDPGRRFAREMEAFCVGYAMHRAYSNVHLFDNADGFFHMATEAYHTCLSIAGTLNPA